MDHRVSLQSGFAPFLPRARLLRLIGSELISDDVVAATELVKNAHDADATFVSLQFVNVLQGDGEIVVRDDGHGMDLDTLLTRWMQPAGSAKGREGTRFTAAGRRVLGEKGVGRFATDKLAARLELVSRRRDEATEIHASFDWDQFDADDRMLSEVHSQWQVRPADWLDSHGTMLRLSRLRSVWNERMFRRLCTRLARLVSPFESRQQFKILVDSDEFPQYSGEVDRGYLEVAPYRMEASFDGTDGVTFKINDGRTVRQTLSPEECPSCGPLKARLFAFDLETESLAKLGPRADVRAWLREWSGISVYRDGFRVWPYGEPHDDWLRLDQRRVNNPVVRLSNNQVVGFVEISSDSNPELRDQTNREGLIHNEAFSSLQRFILLAMQLLEAERQSVRHPQSKRHEKPAGHVSGGAREQSTLPDMLESIAKKTQGKVADDLRRAATRARAVKQTEILDRKRLLDGYTELAAAGQTAALVCRSMSACLDHLQEACVTLKKSFGQKSVEEIVRAANALTRLEGSVLLAAEQLRSVTAVQTAASRRRRGLDVVAELERFKELGMPLLDARGAQLQIQAPSGVYRTEMRPELFVSVLSSLVNNALEWQDPARKLKISVEVRLQGDSLAIHVGDTGRGVKPALEETLFEPMVSGREDGSGMGLTIARSIVEMHGGELTLVTDRRRHGAHFHILLPRKKSRSTVASSGT